MDKNAIKKYAIWARRELISRVSQRAALYGITEDGNHGMDATDINGRLLSDTEKNQRRALVDQIKDKGYQQVMEEVAYTWFNRFAALRFMEVNGYLPSYVRVFTNDDNEFKPQILTEAINLDLEGLDMQKVYDLKKTNDNDTLFKYLMITQCNALNSILPRMFQKIDDYTELLLPDYLLRAGSVIEQMISLIPEDDWLDQVQIIGWLYEGYNTERNEMVYDGNLSRSRITKELLPAATTIFTPEWPIRYMVENSLGRLWLEGHPNTGEFVIPKTNKNGNVDKIAGRWNYYLEDAVQEPEVEEKLSELRKEYADMKPEDIRVIDPCMGSGHILCYLFDILMQIYESYGYTTVEAVYGIVRYNLWGLDIDDRATQLAYFSVMMKAIQYDRRFLSRGIQPHVHAIVESNRIDRSALRYFVKDNSDVLHSMNIIMEKLYDAKEYGSIIKIPPIDFETLYSRVSEIEKGEISIYTDEIMSKILPAIQAAEALSLKYHVVVTNPPYLGSNRFSPKLDSFVKKEYPEVKSDLSMVMYKHAVDNMLMENGFISFITTSSWMFLTSFEKMRNTMMDSISYSSIVDFGTELFEGKVGHNPIVAWVARKTRMNAMISAIRLVDYCYSRRDEKEPEYFNSKNLYIIQQNSFSKIPGSPVAYWVSEFFVNIFKNKRLDNIVSPKQGTSTGDNEKFLRLWHEVPFNNICLNHKHDEPTPLRWYPATKGGDFRKWYGNNEYVVDWQNDGLRIKKCKGSATRNLNANFREGLTWTGISSRALGIRYCPEGFFYLISGKGIVGERTNLLYILGFCCSIVAHNILKVTSPTMSFEVGYIAGLPVAFPETQQELTSINNIVEENISLSKLDWDSDETSWDFEHHPLVDNYTSIKAAYEDWDNICEKRFNRMKANEEELNRLFIDIYGLQSELIPIVNDEDVTVRHADIRRDVKSLISYAVGCMMGRYSIDISGLAYAGGIWDASNYKTFIPDPDAILPICDDEYFEDDIVGRFVKFIEVAYGTDSLDDNLQFIANALGGKGSAREVIRSYFINYFYDDHVKMYQKRPIYWLFDSGKKNGFKCLVYMHRYKPDTIARIRTDYVHEQQSRYRTMIDDIESRIASAETGERVKLNKQLKKVKEQAEELRGYEEKIHHLADQMIEIDLDDGVKHNYAFFQEVLAKIK